MFLLAINLAKALDRVIRNAYTVCVPVTYSTSEVAAAVNVDKSTLLRWLYTGKIPEPKKQAVGGLTVRIWTASDLDRVRKYRDERYRRKP